MQPCAQLQAGKAPALCLCWLQGELLPGCRGERNPQILEVCWDAAAAREGLADGGGEHGAVGEALDQKLPLAAGLLVPSMLGVSALWRQI